MGRVGYSLTGSVEVEGLGFLVVWMRGFEFEDDGCEYVKWVNEGFNSCEKSWR